MIDPLLLSPRTAFPSMGRFQCHHRTRKVGDFHNKLLKYQRVHTNWRLKSSVGRDEMIVPSNYCGKTNQNIPTNGGGLLAQYPLQVKVTTPVSPTCLMDKWWKYMNSELNCIKWWKYMVEHMAYIYIYIHIVVLPISLTIRWWNDELSQVCWSTPCPSPVPSVLYKAQGDHTRLGPMKIRIQTNIINGIIVTYMKNIYVL